MQPLLLLEINEIPWRILDLYLGDERFPHIRKFFRSSQTFTTRCVDSGELSPWVTWPTFHRGMSNDLHGIRNLGQDTATFKGVPIWEEFLSGGHSIGICGSMQSWPPRDPGLGGFYVPDTFAHDASCLPAYLEPFQRFNLDQVSRNGRVVQRQSFFRRETLELVRSLPRLGITLGTLRAIALQLAGERFSPTQVARRPVFQAILQWDLFKSLFRPNSPPAFSTFFTNHVAGLMHRYWHHIFPEDFGGKPGAYGKHKATMDFAMKFLDRILRDAMDFCEKNPDLIVVFATSMGQGPVHREGHHGYEAAIVDSGSLMRSCGVLSTAFRPLLAMMPQVAVEIPGDQERKRVIDHLHRCRTEGGKALFKVQETGSTISITIGTPKKTDVQRGGFYAPGAREGERSMVTWENAGIVMNNVEAGTGYHIPSGVMAKYVKGGIRDDSRDEVRADAARAMLLAWSGIAVPETKQSPVLAPA